jgi:hypothetical protein
METLAAIGLSLALIGMISLVALITDREQTK